MVLKLNKLAYLKKVIASLLLLACQGLLGQAQKLGTVLDATTKTPIEFVDVYNAQEYTTTNKDGRYFIMSDVDSIHFYKIGYEKRSLLLDQLPDTLYLKEKAFELQEVAVTNQKTILEKVRENIPNNYYNQPHTEDFFARILLKKNDTITRIQDLSGQLWRQTLLYTKGSTISDKDFKVQLAHMRKAGIIRDEKKIGFKFASFYHFITSFIAIGLKQEYFEFTEKSIEGSPLVKVIFTPKDKDDKSYTHGHYYINTDNYAVISFYTETKTPNINYSKNKWVRYRTTYYEKEVFFDQDHNTGKYYIKNGKWNAHVECTDEANSFTQQYKLENLFFTQPHQQLVNVKNNVSLKKDMFKLKHPYHKAYWQNQHHLLLTAEMLAFIKELGRQNQEFKISSNLN